MLRALILLMWILIYNTSSASDLKSPSDFDLKNTPIIAKEEDSFLLIPFIITVKIYQHSAGQIKGENCPMYPSCSDYALKALREYHFEGIMKIIDRLHRCGHDLQYYNTVIIDDQIKYFDP